MVEAPAPGAGRVHEQAVEHLASRLVGVEALIDQMPQEPAGLRDTEAEGPADPKRTGLVVLGVRHHVPHRGETHADDHRVARTVDELVDLAWLEASGARDPRLVHEAPLVPRHDAASRQPAVALGQHVVGVLRVGDGIRPVVAVAERQGRDALVHGPVAAHRALDRAGAVGRDRHIEAQGAVAERHVELPAHPDERQPEAQRKRVAEVVRGRRVRSPRRAREVRQHGLAPTVGDLEKRDRAVTRHRLRAQDHEVRGCGDAAARVLRRAREVHDGRVGGVGRVERELDHTGQLLVAARRPEGSPAEDVLTRFDGDATHDRRGGACDDERQKREAQQGGSQTTRRHDRRSIRLDPWGPHGYPRRILDDRAGLREDRFDGEDSDASTTP